MNVGLFYVRQNIQKHSGGGERCCISPNTTYKDGVDCTAKHVYGGQSVKNKNCIFVTLVTIKLLFHNDN